MKMKIEGDKKLTEFWLNQLVTRHVKSDDLGQFATHLKISPAEYDNIRQDFHGNTKEIKWRVLLSWFNKSPTDFTVRDLIAEIKTWFTEGYLYDDIWEKLRENINPDVIPTDAVVKAMSARRRNRRMSSKLRQIVVPVTWAALSVMFTIAVSCLYNTEKPEVNKKDVKLERRKIVHPREINHLDQKQERIPTPDDVAEIQKLTRESVERNLKNSLSHDWIPRDKAKTFPLKDFYVELTWSIEDKGALQNSKTPIRDLREVFNFTMFGKKRINILVEGEPGIGKTAALGSTALEWARQTGLHKFDFVFLILLRLVDKTSSLAHIIIDQHVYLEDIDPSFITLILKGKTNHNVLLLIDGYDEYKPGTNKDMEKLIKQGIGKTFVILTSRPGYLEKSLKDKYDKVLIIEGLNDRNIRLCSLKYLQNHEKSDKLLQQAKDVGISDLLRVPIILLMACVVYDEKTLLPHRKTELLKTIFEVSMNRTALKIINRKSQDIESSKMIFLGKFSWQSLQSDVKQLLLKKEELEMAAPNITNLGLLFETDTDVASLREQPKYVSFPHKLMHEFSASLFIAKSLTEAQNMTETIIQHFPTFGTMMKHREVVAFTGGLLSDPSPLVNTVYTMFITENIHYGTECEHFSKGANLFESLYREASIALPGHHYQNQFINYYRQSRFRDISGTSDRLFSNRPIYRPSRAFVFQNYITGYPLGEMHEHKDITDSVIFVCDAVTPLPEDMFPKCCRISENQPISYLSLMQVKFRNTTEPCRIRISQKNFRLKLYRVSMPTRFMAQLMEPISEASRVDFMEIKETSLAGVKSFNLKNKAASLLHLNFHSVDMDKELCESLLKQVQILTNLKFLKVRPWDRDIPIMFNYQIQPCENFCHINRRLCPEILTSLAHFYDLVHLDFSGNNLAGCISSFLSDSDNMLLSLQRLHFQKTSIAPDDINHITHIIKTGKLPNLQKLNLDGNDLSAMNSEIDRLVNTAIAYHQRELEITLPETSFPVSTVMKWQNQCLGTAIKVSFIILSFGED